MLMPRTLLDLSYNNRLEDTILSSLSLPAAFRILHSKCIGGYFIRFLTAQTTHLERGLRLNEVSKLLAAKHPLGRNLNPGNLTQALQSVASLQVKKDIKPIILDYDQTNLRLNVVDRGFLIWLENQDRVELLELAELPVDGTGLGA
jgi:hypothetical protein